MKALPLKHIVKRKLITIINEINPWSTLIKNEISTENWLRQTYRTYNEPVFWLYPESFIIEDLPNTIEPIVDWKLKCYSYRKETPSFLIKIANGKVWGKNGAVITSDNYLLTDISREFKRGIHSASLKIHFKKPLHVKGNVALLATSGGDVYYHWLLDILPRLHLIQKSGMDKEIDYYVLPELKLPFQLETLKVLGIDKKKIIEINNCSLISADNLFVPSLPSLLGTVNKWGINYIRTCFVSKSESNTKRRLYISREKASTRKVINEKEVIILLEKYHFEIVLAEQLSFIDQVTMFGEAEIIVAPHGGGLTNITFANPGTIVIDMFPPNYIVPCFWILANQLQLKYYYFISGPVQKQNYLEYWNSVNEDFIIDMKKLTTTLSLVLKKELPNK